MWPTITCSAGKRSNTPARIRRSAVQAGLDVPAPRAGPEHEADVVAEARVIEVVHRLGGRHRVQVDRHVERLRGLEDRPEELVVEEALERAAVDHRPDHSELAHGALELGGGGTGIGRRQRGEAGEAIGVGGDRLPRRCR